MDKHVELTISMNTIKERLVKALIRGGEPHADLVTKQIVENLDNTEMGMSQLVLAFMGIEEKLDWTVGDECLLHPDKFSSWRFERADMEQRGMLHKGFLKGVVKSIDMRRRKSVEFEFDGIYKISGVCEDRKITDWVYAADLKRDSDLSLARPGLANLV